MHPQAAEALLETVRRRERQGDCPTEPALSVEVLENLVLTLAHQRDRTAWRVHDLQRINKARSDRWMAGSPGWTTLEIAGELAGEVGELANICKKLRRSEMGLRGNKVSDAELLHQARGELGDVFIVLMLTASKLGVDLYEATCAAFNAKSEQMGFPERFPVAAPPTTETPE